MKWRLMAVVATLMLFLPVFTSCNDKENEPDDPNGGETIDVNKIIGAYQGSLGYSVMGFDPGTIEGKYEVNILHDETDMKKVAVELPECSFTPPIPQAGSFTIPSLLVEGVDVSEKGNVYTISNGGFSIDIEGAKYTGMLTGTIAGKDVKVEYTLRPGRMPMDINFTFLGTLK